jgi:hypothetical protein
MRAKEFLAERQQLDEFVPLAIAALWTTVKATVVWRAFIAALNAYGVYELVTGLADIIIRNHQDIDNMSGEDWFVAVVLILASPWLIKAGLQSPKQFIDLVPASTKQKFGAWVKTTFEGKVKEEIAKKTAATAAPKAASTTPKNPNLVDKPFSKDAPIPATPAPGAGAFNKMATDLTKTKPKNPNLVDRPFSK